VFALQWAAAASLVAGICFLMEFLKDLEDEHGRP